MHSGNGVREQMYSMHLQLVRWTVRLESTQYLCSARYRKRVGWIRCKRSQNLERNASGSRVASISIKSSMAGSVAESDDMYSLHRVGVGVCSNEREGVAFASSRNFMRGGSVTQEGT